MPDDGPGSRPGERMSPLPPQTISRLPDMNEVRSFVIVSDRRWAVAGRKARPDTALRRAVRGVPSDIVAYCRWRAGSTNDALDVVAEVFKAAWRRLDDVPEGDAARVWLYAAARRAIANDRRSIRRRAALAERIALAAPPRDPPSEPDDSVVHAALRRLGRSTARSSCSPNGKASHPHRSRLSCAARRSPREAACIAPVVASARPSRSSPQVREASDAAARRHSDPRPLSRTHSEESHEHVTEHRRPAQGEPPQRAELQRRGRCGRRRGAGADWYRRHR
jgi:DNA-directed RNA polymerase specialized sigma24 family protein